MNNLKQFIAAHGTQVQLVLFIGMFFISWNIENITDVAISQKKWNHAFINVPFIFTNIPGQLLLGFVFAKTIEYTTIHHFGFLYLLSSPRNPFVLFFVTFLFLDFGEYVYHVIMHKVRRLWMFHIVHHSDYAVDISTTLREHPGENIIRLSFTLLWVFISGTVFWTLMLRQIIQAFTTSFAHMNYRLPLKVDNIIGIIFITPNLHQVHHHYKRPYTDCNYGDVLSIWDRLFGTLKKLPAEDLIFGVDIFMPAENSEKFKTLLVLPFRKYKSLKKVTAKIISMTVNSS